MECQKHFLSKQTQIRMKLREIKIVRDYGNNE